MLESWGEIFPVRYEDLAKTSKDHSLQMLLTTKKTVTILLITREICLENLPGQDFHRLLVARETGTSVESTLLVHVMCYKN